MTAGLYYPALVQNNVDIVFVTDRGVAVGDDKGRAPSIREAMPFWISISVRLSMDEAAFFGFSIAGGQEKRAHSKEP